MDVCGFPNGKLCEYAIQHDQGDRRKYVVLVMFNNVWRFYPAELTYISPMSHDTHPSLKYEQGMVLLSQASYMCFLW